MQGTAEGVRDLEAPKAGYILFSQHGWADTNRKMLAFGRRLAEPDDVVVAPSLGYLRTFHRLDRLIDRVDDAATAALAEYPELRARIVGHSMGGLIWLDVLDRHPDWWSRVDALVLLGSPVGGTRLGTYLDPTGIAIGRDLSVDRRSKAERIAATVPTMTVAGDLLGGRDGTVSVSSTRFANAHTVTVPWASHAGLLSRPAVRKLIMAFFRQKPPVATDTERVIERLRAVPGIDEADRRRCRWAQVAMMFPDGQTIRVLPGPLGLDHAFVANNDGHCIYAGRVGWREVGALHRALRDLKRTYAGDLV